MAANNKGRSLAWDFLKDQWDEFDRRYGGGGFGLMRLVAITNAFTTNEQRNDVEAFFEAHPTPAAERTIRQALERIALNVAWLDRNRDELALYLRVGSIRRTSRPCQNDGGAASKSSDLQMSRFEIIGPITEIETIAFGNSIRVIADLRRRYGQGNWRKRKGIATVRLRDGTMRDAELHWYEAHGIGRRRIKIKRVLG